MPPSVEHDAVLMLFRNRPTLAAELLRDSLHIPVPEFDHVRIADAALGELVPTEYRADLVLLLEGASLGARRSPERAVLSAMVHGQDDDAVEIAQAALTAASGLDDERARLYADLVLRSVHAGARAILEALMASGKYEYQSDFARKYVAQGEAEGRAHSVLHVLEVRGIDVPGDVRERILSCSDVATLDAWLERALTAKSSADVVAD